LRRNDKLNQQLKTRNDMPSPDCFLPLPTSLYNKKQVYPDFFVKNG